MQSNENYLSILKENTKNGSNFIEYFATIGVKPEIFLNDWLYTSDLEELNTIYKSHFKPEIITKFPPFSKEVTDVEGSVINHCFPEEFKVMHFDHKPKPKQFSVILDNHYYSSKFPQKYVTCLLCYESIANYKELNNIYENSLEQQDIPIHSPNSIITNTKLSAVTLSSSGINTQNSDIFKDKEIFLSEKINTYYIPKSLVFVSLHPFFNEYEKMLEDIYNYSLKEHSIPIYKIIENYVLEIPVPPRGVFTVEYNDINSIPREIKQNIMNELPLIHVNLKHIFNKFSVEDIVRIMESLLLETKIIFFSSEISLLTPIIYGFIALLYPLEYPHQVATFLPKNNYSLLEAITPALLGINQEYDPSFFDDDEYCLAEDIDYLIVDIDNSKLNYVEKGDEKEIPLPSYYKKSLEKALNNIMSFQKRRDTKIKMYEINDFYSFNREVSAVFYDFYSMLLENYSKFLNISYLTSEIKTETKNIFKLNEFIDSFPNSDKKFFEKFIKEATSFVNFLQKKINPMDSDDKLRVLQFDEKIEQKTQRFFSKEPDCIFTNSKRYAFDNKIRIFKKRGLSTVESEYYSNKHNNTKSLLMNGMIVSPLPNSNSSFEFKTPIFPLLMTEEFLCTTYTDYFNPPYLMGEIETINSEIFSKTYLGNIKLKQSDMENYIFLCWIQLWAITFWYNDPEEKDYRFQQLLCVLNLTSHHEIEIFDLIFESLSKYGDDDMVMKLYDILIKLGLNPSSKIRKIIEILIKKKKNLTIYNERGLKGLIEYYCRGEKKEVSSFRRRTFKSKYYPNLFNESITFFAFYICLECQKEIDLIKMSSNFQQMSREIVWGKCDTCHYVFLPKLSVQLGVEVNLNGTLKHNTSIFDSFVLYTPLFLKTNYNNFLFKDFGIEMNLEELTHQKYNSMFWGSLWYFGMKGLPYDLFLPYEKRPKIDICIKAIQNLQITSGNFGKLENNENNKGVRHVRTRKVRSFNDEHISIETQVTDFSINL